MAAPISPAIAHPSAATVRRPVPHSREPQHPLIIADGLCPKIVALLPAARYDLVSLEQQPHPLLAIASALQERRLAGEPVETLHIVAHGRSGAFQLGGQWISAAALLAAADQLAQWQVSQIALWSCEAGADGDFIALLEELTGARVWASRTSLGRTSAGQHWQLASSSTNAPAPAAPWSAETLQTWPHQLATYTFSSSYQVTNEAGKETNFHTFNTAAPLQGVTITDGSTIREFSGNDISAQAVVIGGVTYYGWVSRPIKVTGQVVGFYFWTDLDFTTLQLAQADGNADADGSTADNLGFVLVVAGQESFFTSGGIGSSSDRVDSAVRRRLDRRDRATT